MTLKQYGYVIQALTEDEKYTRLRGEDGHATKLKLTLQKVLRLSKNHRNLLEDFDEEQLYMMAQALEDTATRRQVTSVFDSDNMRKIARLVREMKVHRETKWIESRFREGIGFEAAI